MTQRVPCLQLQPQEFREPRPARRAATSLSGSCRRSNLTKRHQLSARQQKGAAVGTAAPLRLEAFQTLHAFGQRPKRPVQPDVLVNAVDGVGTATA